MDLFLISKYGLAAACSATFGFGLKSSSVGYVLPRCLQLLLCWLLFLPKHILLLCDPPEYFFVESSQAALSAMVPRAFVALLSFQKVNFATRKAHLLSTRFLAQGRMFWPCFWIQSDPWSDDVSVLEELDICGSCRRRLVLTVETWSVPVHSYAWPDQFWRPT